MLKNAKEQNLSVNSEVDLKGENANKKIVESLIKNRFVIVKNHGVSIESLNEIYSSWGNFFNAERKLKWFRTDEYDEGYVPVNTEKAVGNDNADWKEYYQTHWEGSYPDFIDCALTKKIVREIVNLGSSVIEAVDSIMPSNIKNAMDMSLSKMIANSDRHGFRVIHYPPMKEIKIPPRAGAHTDICFLTILPTATADGLELQDSDGNWHVPYLKESNILVFSGDMLEMATNGYICAAMHRVTADVEIIRNNSRFSFPIFVHPRREVVLKDGITAMEALRTRITEIGFNGDLLKY